MITYNRVGRNRTETGPAQRIPYAPSGVNLVVKDLIQLDAKEVGFDVCGSTTSVALHTDTGHPIPMSNRP